MFHSLRSAAIIAPLCVAFMFSAAAAEKAPELRLPDTVTPVSYRAELTLDPAKDDFSGLIDIKVKLNQSVQTIWLNAAQITINDASLKAGGQTYTGKPAAGGKDFIGLEFPSAIPAGAGEISIHYSGKFRLQDSAGVFRMEDNGNKYLYTQFEATDARAAFPCFDEPGYKVPWQLTLNVPEGSTAVSNTPILHERNREGGKEYVFKETKPLPSYLIAFAVGPFDYVDAGKAGKNHAPVRIVTPKGHAADAKYAAEVTATILTRLEDYFGIPFPYEKSDQVSIPVTFGFGAMENAGMVTYGQTIILARPDIDTTNRQRQYVSVAAHELAHQWFGDLVTTEWWNDIWLNEGFATWMQEKLVAEWKPEWNTRIGDVDQKLTAKREDSLISARKVRQEITSQGDINNAFDAITYLKGSAVIGMFENWVGPEEFRKGVRSYLKQYAFRNATAPDFLDAISSSSKKDITKAFSSFLNQAGVPLVSVALDCKQSAPILHLQQERFLPLGSKGSADETWQIPVCVRYGSGESGQSECTLLSQPKQDWALKTSSCPAWVQANDNALGYYRVEYQSGLLDELIKGDVTKRMNAPERVDFMGNAEALTGAGKLSAADALKLVETFHGDPDRHVVQSALELADIPGEHLVPDNLLPNYQRFLQKNFDDRARQIGWAIHGLEPDDISLLRPPLLRTMATSGGDRQLAAEARQLADKWLEDHSSVNPNLVPAVLRSAAYNGDKAFFDRLLAELKKTKDRQERGGIVRAMSEFRDSDAIKAAMNAVLSGEIPFLEGVRLLIVAGQNSDATRMLPLEFLRAHYDEILAKSPNGGSFDFGSVLPVVGQSYCDAQSKEELKKFFDPRVAQLTGAPRTLSRILESIDVCIASKAAEEPSVVAFLGKY